MKKIEIINRALTKLGANNIKSLDEKTIEAETALITYDESLSSLLSELDWHFALKEDDLTPSKRVAKWRKGNYFVQSIDFWKKMIKMRSVALATFGKSCFCACTHDKKGGPSASLHGYFSVIPWSAFRWHRSNRYGTWQRTSRCRR